MEAEACIQVLYGEGWDTDEGWMAQSQLQACLGQRAEVVYGSRRRRYAQMAGQIQQIPVREACCFQRLHTTDVKERAQNLQDDSCRVQGSGLLIIASCQWMPKAGYGMMQTADRKPWLEEMI